MVKKTEKSKAAPEAPVEAVAVADAPEVEAQAAPAGDIIFAKTRHKYDSYTDLWKLVDLSGFPTCYIDEIDPTSDNTYIFSPVNGEAGEGWRKNSKAKLILWQLEWSHEEGDFQAPPGVDEVWSGDAWQAQRIGAKYVPMGSHPDLAEPAPVDMAQVPYDIAFLAYLTNRRSYIRDRLTQFKVSPSSAWGRERHDILESSRLYLHLHQWDNIPTVAPLRMVVAAAYGLPVLSEEVVDKGIFEGKMITETYDRMLGRVGHWLNYPQLREYGEALQTLLCEERTFRKSVEANV